MSQLNWVRYPSDLNVTLMHVNNKGTDQAEQMHRLVCAFIIHMQQSQFKVQWISYLILLPHEAVSSPCNRKPFYIHTFIKLPFVIKIFVFLIFKLPFYTGFTVLFSPFPS